MLSKCPHVRSKKRETPDWFRWSAWCLTAEARVIAATGGPEQTLGAGCEPVFSPDGERIALSTPPSAATPSSDGTVVTADNSIIVVSRDGSERATLAASGPGTDDGHLVYSPVWSPDGERLAYQRFLSYQSLIDINRIEETAVDAPLPAALVRGRGGSARRPTTLTAGRCWWWATTSATRAALAATRSGARACCGWARPMRSCGKLAMCFI